MGWVNPWVGLGYVLCNGFGWNLDCASLITSVVFSTTVIIPKRVNILNSFALEFGCLTISLLPLLPSSVSVTLII